MEIPISLKSILDENQGYTGIVHLTISRFEQYIKNKQPEFFPDYTEHGIDHIESVLFATEWIMGDSIKLLNEKDVVVLILSVLLHDYGMYITYDGFLTLLQNNNKIIEFDTKTWLQLWNEFKSNVRRWDEKKQIDVCGKLIDTSNIILDNDLKDSTKKVIGEFLRTHHPRLAHEIALFGFPGVNNSLIKFASGLEDQLLDLSGLVARSHGDNLRNTFSYLDDRYFDLREPHSVKAIYLMVLLRIADYLQFSPNRAPKSTFDIKKISSPYSRLQWQINNSITNVNYNKSDPELIFVVAQPSTVYEYLELRKLFNDIQSELDHSWAVIGEVYGENASLSQLKIKLRRIRSNIDSNEYTLNLKYIPKKVTFESDPEIIKLLIQPLYGDDPTYGVRELLQNSLDACRERAELQKMKEPIYLPEIKLTLQQNSSADYEFIIEDNGIGMNEDILLNYFFKAGSTFRKSIDWKNNFTDETGESTVQRSGRFGVGVLAAFLLGDEIYVETKRVGPDNIGYSFSSKLDDNYIEIRKADLNIGTKIRVIVKDNKINKLKDNLRYQNYEDTWVDWYKFNYPNIDISIPNNWARIIKRLLDINIENSHIIGWNRFFPAEFNAVDWSYEEKTVFLCNGIVIPEKIEMKNHVSFPSFPKTPSISVIDFNGRLSLSLSRSKINGQLPFIKELAYEICIDLFKNILNYSSLDINNGIEITQLQLLDHPSTASLSLSWKTVDWREKNLIFIDRGYLIPHPYCIEKSSLERLILIVKKNDYEDLDLIIPTISKAGYSVLNELFNISEYKDLFYSNEIKFAHKILPIQQKKIYLHKEDYLYFFDKPRRLTQHFKESVTITFINNDWVCMRTGPDFDSLVDDTLLCAQIKCLVEYSLPSQINTQVTEYNQITSDIILPLLEEHFQEDATIPYSLEERKLMFPQYFFEN